MAVLNLIAKRLHEMTNSIKLKDDIRLHVEMTFTSDEETYSHNKVRILYNVYSTHEIIHRCQTTRCYSLDVNLTSLISEIENDIKLDIKEYLKPEGMTLSMLIERLKSFLGDDVWYDIANDRICDFCVEWISFYPLKGKLLFTEDDYDKISDFLLNDKGERFLIRKHFNQFMDYMQFFNKAQVIWWQDEKAGLDLPLKNNGKCFMSTFDLIAFSDVRSFLNWYEIRYSFKENSDIGLEDFDDDDFRSEDDFS